MMKAITIISNLQLKFQTDISTFNSPTPFTCRVTPFRKENQKRYLWNRKTDDPKTLVLVLKMTFTRLLPLRWYNRPFLFGSFCPTACL